MVGVDGSTEKHRKSQLIKSIYMDAWHCGMAQQPPFLLLNNSKNTLSNQYGSRFGPKPSHYLSLSSSSFLGSKLSCELLATFWPCKAQALRVEVMQVNLPSSRCKAVGPSSCRLSSGTP